MVDGGQAHTCGYRFVQKDEQVGAPFSQAHTCGHRVVQKDEQMGAAFSCEFFFALFITTASIIPGRLQLRSYRS